MVRKLKFHEQKLLKKVDFIKWDPSVDNSLHEAKIMRAYHLRTREEYTVYNKMSRLIRETARKLRDLNPKDPFRTRSTAELLNRLHAAGLIATKESLEMCDKVTVSSFCRRRLPVVMVRCKMAENLKVATQYVMQAHVRVGPNLVTDPAFLVSRNLEDFVTWTHNSAVKRHALDYNQERDDFDLNC